MLLRITTAIFLLLVLPYTTSTLPRSRTKVMMSDQSGAINEKVRRYSSPLTSDAQTATKSFTDDAPNKASFSHNSKAHLLIALEGLDRYPNYLNRWNNKEDLDELELALVEQLRKVRQQRQAISDRRVAITELCNDKDAVAASPLLEQPISWEDIKQILNPALVKVIFQSRQFRQKGTIVPTLEQILSGQVTVQLDAHLLEQLMEPEVYDVYSLPLFQQDFCDALRSRITALQQNGGAASLRMTTRPIDLDSIGLGWINDVLLHLIVRPISRHLYKDTECAGGDLDWRQGYVASYEARPEQASGRNRLVSHTDDSEVTLNIGLGQDFEGGLLEFYGLRGEEHELLGDYEPIKGRAVLHAGRHFHQVTQVTNGHRFALILWARSWNGVRAQTCPCCWMNRRKESNCVCGPRWN